MPYFNNKYRISLSKIEECDSLQSITHPSIRACLQYLNINDGLEISTVGDLPARSGLGSSSSFTAALLSALHFYKNDFIDNITVTSETIHVEQNILRENVGIQDQIQVCCGGFNVIKINPDSSYSLVSLNSTSNLVRQINDSLILVYSGIARFSSSVHSASKKDIPSTIYENSLKNISTIANTFANKLITHDADFSLFSELLIRSWESKSSTFSPNSTTDELLSIYQKCMDSGASCGKLLGAGGGGFFAFFVPPDDHASFIKKMAPLICVPASIEYQGITRVL